MTKEDLIGLVNSIEEAELKPLEGMDKSSFSSLLRSYGKQTLEQREKEKAREEQDNNPDLWKDVAKLCGKITV